MPPTSLVPSFAAVVLPPSAQTVISAATPGLSEAPTLPTALVELGLELAPYLATIPDPRGRQGRRYPLLTLLVFCLVGFCTGCQGYLSVARWGQALKPEVLRELGFARGRTPCAATWLNLFRVLDWDLVARQFQAWAAVVDVRERERKEAERTERAERAERADPPWEGLALDGKTLRGSLAVGAETAHIVSVVSHDTGVSVSETGVNTKQGELTVAPELLARVLGPGRVITGDALFTQRELCRQIRAGGSHYVLVVKENQPTLLREVQAVFRPVTRAGARAQERRTVWQVNTGHGRIENRFLLLATVTPEQVAWPEVAQVFCLERRRYQPARGGKAAQESREVVYGITSLGSQEAGPATVLRLQRGHWSIENQVHYVLDTFFREDERRIRDGRVARGVAALRRGAPNLLRRLGRRSHPEAADRVKADPTLLLPLLGLPRE